MRSNRETEAEEAITVEMRAEAEVDVPVEVATEKEMKMKIKNMKMEVDRFVGYSVLTKAGFVCVGSGFSFTVMTPSKHGNMSYFMARPRLFGTCTWAGDVPLSISQLSRILTGIRGHVRILSIGCDTVVSPRDRVPVMFDLRLSAHASCHSIQRPSAGTSGVGNNMRLSIFGHLRCNLIIYARSVFSVTLHGKHVRDTTVCHRTSARCTTLRVQKA